MALPSGELSLMVLSFARDIFRPLGDVVAGDTELWTDPAGRRLSDRVWIAGEETRRQIDKRLRLAIARGDDPLQVARELEQFLDPRLAPVRNPKTGRLEKWERDGRGRIVRDENGRPKPAQPKGAITRSPQGGSGSYPARRLARTEITRAFGNATKDAAALNPFVIGIQWGLSSPYDPKRDAGVCADNARGSSRGMPRGVYRLNEVPRYPAHPQERCYLAPYAEPDTASVIAQLQDEFRSQPVRVFVAPQPGGLRERVVSLFRIARQLLGREAA